MWETASQAAVPGAEALVVVVVEAVSAAPVGCGHGAGCCAGSAWPLWTFCLMYGPGILQLPLKQGDLFCSQTVRRMFVQKFCSRYLNCF